MATYKIRQLHQAELFIEGLDSILQRAQDFLGFASGSASVSNKVIPIITSLSRKLWATPYRATEYFIDQMPLPDSLRANVMIKYYEAGHMMYVHPPSLVQFREDLVAFVATSQ